MTDDRFGKIEDFRFHRWSEIDYDDYEYAEDARWAKYSLECEYRRNLCEVKECIKNGTFLKAWEPFRHLGAFADKEEIKNLFITLQNHTKQLYNIY